MKAKTLSAVVAVSGLMAVSSAVPAGEQEAYYRAFPGDAGVVQVEAEREVEREAGREAESSDSMGKAAYGTATTTPFAGPQGGILVLTHNGLQPWEAKSPDSPVGKAAFDSGGSAGDAGETAFDAYRRAFYGD